MRENRTCGSEGGEAQSLPYPYPVAPLLTYQPNTPKNQPQTTNFQLSFTNRQPNNNENTTHRLARHRARSLQWRR